MKRNLLTTLMLVLTSTMAWAGDISQEEAQQIAAQAIASFGSASARQATTRQSAQPQTPVLAYSARSLQDRTAFYVFNSAEQEDGFVIVSADDVTPSPILGFCDHGSFDYDQAPCCLKALLEQYEAQIAYLRENPSAAKTRGFVISYGNEVVAPLIGTRWDQSAPFNKMCPEVHGSLPPTGCVATALAQIMNYWRYPQKGRGERHYQFMPDKDTYIDNYANFSSSVYDWDKIERCYEDAGGQAVALLMRDVGASMNMCYGTEIGSLPARDVTSWAKIFDYDLESMESVGFGQIDTISWTDELWAQVHNTEVRMREELDAKRPVYMSLSYLNHAVVVDGYTDADFFHINFGWGGYGDGYYQILQLDPEQTIPELRKKYDHITIRAVVGIKPAHSPQKDNLYYTLDGDEAKLNCIDRKGDLVLPSTFTDEKGKTYPVTSISRYACELNDSLTSITMPSSIKTVNYSAFELCTKLKNVVLSSSLVELGYGVFEGCKSLPSVSLPGSLQRMGTEVFIDCTGLKSINIPGSIKTVPEFSFRRCSALDDVNLEEGVERIGNGAFYFCTGLKEITLPATLTSIGDSAFIHDYALETVNDGYGVVRVGSYAFHGCKKLANFNFGPVRYIRDFAFTDCKFENLYMLNTQIIGNQAFWNNPIKSATFDALEFLGDRVFNHDAQTANTMTDFHLGPKATVQSLSGLPPSLTKIQIDAGNTRYTAVNNIIYSKDMTSLVYASCMYYDSDARQYLYRTTLDIPESVTRIERGAVHSNWGWDAYTKLTEVTIPSSVTAIDTLAFADCYNIQKVYNHATVPQPLEGCIFGGTPGILYVPEGCRDAYLAADGWKDMQIYEDLPIPNYDEEDDYTTDDEETRVNGVRIHSQNGAGDVWTYEVLFNSKPELTYEKEVTWDGQMTVDNILLTANCELEMVLNWRPYPEEQPAKLSVWNLKMLEFFYDEEADGIESVSSGSNSSTVRFSMNGRTIDISGLKTGDDAVLYALDGTMVVSAKSNADGRASITVPGASTVTYVLKVGDASFKIITK